MGVLRACRLAGPLCAAMAALTSPRFAEAQELGLGDRAPRFFAASSTDDGGMVEIDAANSRVLRQVVSLTIERPTVGQLLDEVQRQTGLRFFYDEQLVSPDRPVTLRADSITVATALTGILIDAGVDALFSRGGHVALVRKRPVRAELVTGTVSGRVTDAKTGQGLVGADVVLEGTRWRTTTGDDGRFRLAGVAPGSHTLAVRRIGYGRRTQSVTVVADQEVTVDVALEPVATQLDEIVTTVTGDQRRVELGHVVGRINADSLVREAPVSSITELLTGRVPGLQVFQAQGTVGGDVRLQVRTPNSLLLNTEPIVLVDGIRYTSGSSGGSPGPFGVEPTSRLNDLNPNDIESIEVVKGASAATLYGTDAANGVIVITTKGGRPGPARWNAYGRATTMALPRIHYQDRYWGWGTASTSCRLQDVAAGACTQDSVTVLPNPLNDPSLTLFDGKPRWEYGMNVAGGRQDLRYYFSGDIEDATGPVQMPPVIAEQLRQQRGVAALPEEQLEPNALTKASLRANVTASLGERTHLRVNTGYTQRAARTLALGSGNPYLGGAAAGGTPTDPYGSFASPQEAFAATSTERVNRFFGTASAQWGPTSWLSARATAGLDLSNANRASLRRRGESNLRPEGEVGDDRTRQLASTAELGLTASFRRGRLSSRTSVGAQYVRNLRDGLSSRGSDLPPGGESVGEAASTRSFQLYSETVTLGSYLEETIGLNERLFVTGALRVDGASAFGRNYDAAVYPKASVSWLASEEPFVPRLPGVDELRLRYAFGASGQQATPDMVLPQFFTQTAFLDGASRNVASLTALGNPDLRPERVREHEFGFDATALQGRVQLGATWYRRTTVDQIIAINLPVALGSVYTNLGRTTGRGFEAQLTARVIKAGFLSWDLAVQHSSHTTTLADLGSADPSYSSGGSYVEGYPLGARFMPQILGYADANGDGIIAPAEVRLSDTAVYVGESTAPRSQTLTTVIGLFRQRLRLSALLERRAGFTQIDQLAVDHCVFGRSCREGVDPDTPLAEQAEVASLYATAPGQSSAYYQPVEPGDFTRLREVTAALDLPVTFARALRLRSATLSISARNLALWTDFSGPDPESAFVNGLYGGTADGIPQGRSWTLRVDLGL